MTTKAAFDAQEWADVTSAPALTAMSVVAAERGGTLRESVSLARAYTDARGRAATELLRELLSSPPVIDPSSVRPGGDAIRAASELLRAAVALVERTATAEELEDYKRFVLDLADTVASSHKEGGFLGIGGRPVSDAERQALDAIAATLGIAREQAPLPPPAA
jgi:hypothetical protein